MDSFCTKKMQDVEDQFLDSIGQVVNNGSSFFWWDNWSGLGALASRSTIAPVPLEEVRITNLYSQHEGWNLQPVEGASTAADLTLIRGKDFSFGVEEDVAVRACNALGDFTLSSAFAVVRRRQTEHGHLHYVWDTLLPLKISFFMWCLLNSKMPLPDVLMDLGYQTVTKCVACECDSLRHFFFFCPLGAQ